jgi:hypothetical protein
VKKSIRPLYAHTSAKDMVYVYINGIGLAPTRIQKPLGMRRNTIKSNPS